MIITTMAIWLNVTTAMILYVCMRFYYLIIIFFLLFTNNAFGTHASGLDLTYTCDPGGQVLVGNGNVVITITTGTFGYEQSWDITDASGVVYYSENLSIPAGRSVSTVSGTVRTTSDGAQRGQMVI